MAFKPDETEGTSRENPEELLHMVRMGDLSAAYELLGRQAPMRTWREALDHIARAPEQADVEAAAHRTLRRPEPVVAGLLDVVDAVHSPKAAHVAHAVAAVINALLGTGFTDESGVERAVGTNDVLVVAPYNAQVRRLRQSVPAGVRVGTVDKFQVQEAPVVLISMASSTAEDAPRGIAFAFDRHRVNVATSRAQCRVVLVCALRLLDADCKTVEQMRLVNAVCRFVELAGQK